MDVAKLCDEIADRGYSGEQAKLLRRLAQQVDGDPAAAVDNVLVAFPKIFARAAPKVGAPRRR